MLSSESLKTVLRVFPFPLSSLILLGMNVHNLSTNIRIYNNIVGLCADIVYSGVGEGVLRASSWLGGGDGLASMGSIGGPCLN